MSNQTVLHQWEVSPFCGKVRRILDEKKIPYRSKNYNGRLVAVAARLSPVGKLPILDINGERLAGSGAIARYLEEAFPQSPSLIPEDAQLRAQVSVYEDWADASLYWYNFYFRLKYDDAWQKTSALFAKGRPAFERVLVRIVGRIQYMKQLNGQGLGRYPKQEVEGNFLALIAQLEVTLSSNEWLVGNSKTLADIAVASQLHEIKRTSHMKDALTSLPAVNRWLNRT